jgi:hypothetical protein
MNKNELIEKAVIELSGEWPSGKSAKSSSDYLIIDGKLWVQLLLDKCMLCTREEFNAAAKRLGCINGYKWGVEYPTNGKRPNLPDDMVVDIRINKDDSLSGRDRVKGWVWGADDCVSFRIVDERYKPADEKTEIEKLGIMPPMNKNERCSIEPAPANPWFEASELPPVGTECEYLCDEFGNYKACKILAIHGYTAAFCIDGFGNTIFTGTKSTHKFRPIKTDKEKAIEAADAAIHEYSAGAEIRTELLGALYDAGLLRLPEATTGDEK